MKAYHLEGQSIKEIETWINLLSLSDIENEFDKGIGKALFIFIDYEHYRNITEMTRQHCKQKEESKC